ncbi:hypothetical protein ACFVT6_12865 [Streptomyces sp. NPDC058049]|uniref:hypothetical protein n=1 Tax=Streptomyces sp. NPDC058049 TaxID=3346314 RepID=UPI0036EAE394
MAQHPDLGPLPRVLRPAQAPGLADHMLRLLELRDPSARRNGVKTLHIRLVELAESRIPQKLRRSSAPPLRLGGL